MKRVCNRWTERETEILSLNFSELGAEKCRALLPGRSASSITGMAKRLGLRGPEFSERERFESKFRVTPGCWIWTASLGTTGYGQFSKNGRMVKAHRYSFALYSGTSPAGFSVLHKCDNPRCVNPDHLFLGSQADNMKDMKGKGRSTSGERGPGRKLSRAQVMAIREDKRSNYVIAREYGICNQQVSRIKRRENWARV